MQELMDNRLGTYPKIKLLALRRWEINCASSWMLRRRVTVHTDVAKSGEFKPPDSYELLQACRDIGLF